MRLGPREEVGSAKSHRHFGLNDASVLVVRMMESLKIA